MINLDIQRIYQRALEIDAAVRAWRWKQRKKSFVIFILGLCLGIIIGYLIKSFEGKGVMP